MKSLIFSLFVAALTLPLGATVVGRAMIEQPLNLGSHADPARIPLAEVGTWSNNFYGIHEVIGAPRPLAHGAFGTPFGVELNANLASAFGISVEPEQSTLVPELPVSLRIKAWPKPNYSPYTREQVVAATIHCLLRAVIATPKCPLKLRIVAEDPQENQGLQKFASDYVNAPNDSGKSVVPVMPTPVPGCHIEIGSALLPTVVFDDPPHHEPVPSMKLGFVPCDLETGEFGGEGLALLPVLAGEGWHGEPLDIVTLSAPLVYNCFTLHRVDNEANDLIERGKIGRHPRTGEYPGYTWIDPHVVVPDNAPVTESDTRLVAAMCHAFVLTCRPAAAKPLRIRLPRSIEAFATHPAWQPVTDQTDLRDENRIECAFVWDPEKMQVSGGGTPGHHLERTKLGTWRVVRDTDAPVRDEPSPEPPNQ